MKRILVVSDSHGSNHNIKLVLEKEKNIDMLLHAGDIECNPQEIRAMLNCPVYIVSGNNDSGSDLPSGETIKIGNSRIYLTHGHRFNINYTSLRLRLFAQQEGYQMVIFGHTHVPFLQYDEGIQMFNPGSISLPRQTGRNKTYGIIEVDDNGVIKPSICQL